MKTYKKLLLSLLSLGLLLTLFGCKQEADGIWPRTSTFSMSVSSS